MVRKQVVPIGALLQLPAWSRCQVPRVTFCGLHTILAAYLHLLLRRRPPVSAKLSTVPHTFSAASVDNKPQVRWLETTDKGAKGNTREAIEKRKQKVGVHTYSWAGTLQKGHVTTQSVLERNSKKTAVLLDSLLPFPQPSTTSVYRTTLPLW